MIIYKVTNKINGKVYIGQTISSLQTRKSQHLYESRKNSYIFHRAIRKYGFINFSWEVLCICESREELNEMEFHYIKQYHSYMREGGYNMNYGYYSIYELSDITRKKMSISKTGNKNPWYGKKRPEISDIHKGDKNCMRNPEIRKKFLKTYLLSDINNIEYIVNDLHLFCKEHNININSMYSISSTGKTIKGWKCSKLSEPDKE